MDVEIKLNLNLRRDMQEFFCLFLLFRIQITKEAGLLRNTFRIRP